MLMCSRWMPGPDIIINCVVVRGRLTIHAGGAQAESIFCDSLNHNRSVHVCLCLSHRIKAGTVPKLTS